MNDPLKPFMDQLEKIWGYVLGLPKHRWGTVTDSSPLMVRLDGDATSVEPQSPFASIAVGRRVSCLEQRRKVIILNVVEI